MLQRILALSKDKRDSTTGGGLQKTAKLYKDCDPSLAKASAHWLASRKTWTTRLFGISFKRFLQSIRRGSINKFSVSLFISITTLKASNSMISCCSPNSLASSSPSLSAQSSANMLLMYLIYLLWSFDTTLSHKINKNWYSSIYNMRRV